MATRTTLCKMDAAGFKRTDEGYLQAKVNPTRIGVFTYYDSESGKTINEFRPPDEVGSPNSLGSLNHKVVTDDHPPELLSAKTTRKYQAGIVSSSHKMDVDNIHTISDVIVMDADLIAKIDGGKQQVSCGYTCDVENTPGTYNGERYDRIQRNIKYNHLAIVHRGRAGSAALRADSEGVTRFDAWEVDTDTPETITKKDTKNEEVLKRMAIIRIDNRDFTVDEAVEIAYSNKAKADDAAIAVAQEKADKAVFDLATVQAKLDESKEKIASLEAVNLEARVDAVLELRDKARPILGKDYAYAGKSEQQIKQDALAKARPALKLDGLSVAYIDARFDAVIEDQQAAPAGRDTLDSYDSAPVSNDNWASQYSLVD